MNVFLENMNLAEDLIDDGHDPYYVGSSSYMGVDDDEDGYGHHTQEDEVYRDHDHYRYKDDDDD